jgi:hypothetical protein
LEPRLRPDLDARIEEVVDGADARAAVPEGVHQDHLLIVAEPAVVLDLPAEPVEDGAAAQDGGDLGVALEVGFGPRRRRRRRGR